MLKEFDFVEKYIEKYIEDKEFKHNKTQQAYRRCLINFNIFIKNMNSNYKISSFDAILKEFDDDIKKKGLADSTRFFTLKVVNNYFKYLGQKGIIDILGTSLTELFDKSDEEALYKVKKDSIISIEEKSKLFNYLRSFKDFLNLFLFMIAFYCGLKTNFLCNLRFSDFFIGSNAKLCFDNRIYKKEPFIIELPDEVKEIYLEILPEKPRIFIFIKPSGKNYYARYINRVFEMYCKNAGINHYSPMDFRHSSVYYYVKENGVNIEKIRSRYNWTWDNLKRLYGDLLGL